jgi:hypothetical protein
MWRNTQQSKLLGFLDIDEWLNTFFRIRLFSIKKLLSVSLGFTYAFSQGE